MSLIDLWFIIWVFISGAILVYAALACIEASDFTEEEKEDRDRHPERYF